MQGDADADPGIFEGGGGSCQGPRKCRSVGTSKLTSKKEKNSGGGGPGTRERFFSWGGKSVDMPSDCQILGGGTGISIPLRQKVGGQLPPLPPPPAPAPLSGGAGSPKRQVLCNLHTDKQTNAWGLNPLIPLGSAAVMLKLYIKSILHPFIWTDYNVHAVISSFYRYKGKATIILLHLYILYR